MKPDVCFVGLGYIGLPTAITMANHGLSVLGFDVNTESVNRINSGIVTIVEPGLEEALAVALKSKRFSATDVAPKAKVYVLAVPTPFTDTYECDMRFIYSAAEEIAPQLDGDELIVLESTSPPRTTEKLAKKVAELRPDLRVATSDDVQGDNVVYFAHCPERILPGHALEELITNDRIIGGMTREATRRAAAIYKSFCQGELLETNDRTAEMAKLTENSFRDVNIAFANELSLISEEMDIDVWELIDLANHHPRVNILQPGPGVGGHCIAVDPWFIVSAAPESSKLIHTARLVNDGKPDWVISKVREETTKLDAKRIALLGLAFKPDIDDLRESPALEIADRLLVEFPNLDFAVCEPNVSQLPEQLAHFDNVSLLGFEEAVASADLVVLLVNHKEFGSSIPLSVSRDRVIDTRGAWRK